MADYERRERGDRDRGDREERIQPPRRPRRDNGPAARRRKGKGRSEYCPDGECFNYKEVEILERYVNEVGKIKPRRVTGNCARCQRELAREIKRARFLGLLPFIANTD
jgi:small subunit ribosomal protein S18